MSDVLQVGGLEAKLTVDTTQFARSMQASGDRMQGLYTQVNAMPPALQKLEAQQQKVTRQMEEQRRKVLQMDAALDGAKSEYAALQQAVGRYSDEDMDAHFSKETAEIRKAEKQLAAYVNQMKALEQQRQQTVEKLNASAAKQTAAEPI